MNFIKADLIKPGACVIDVGINRITTPDKKDKIVGDVDFDGERIAVLTCLVQYVGPQSS